MTVAQRFALCRARRAGRLRYRQRDAIGVEGDLDRQMPREGLYLLGLWPCSIQREAQAWPVQSVFGHLSEDGLASVVDDGFAVIV